MNNNDKKGDNNIYKNSSFFSSNRLRDNIYFHYNREVMVISQNGKMVMKEAPYSHGLIINNIFCNYFKDRIYYNKLLDMVSDDCSLMCELLSLDGCIVLIIENDSCIICFPNNISGEQLSLLLYIFDDLCLNVQRVNFYIWRCLDNDLVEDKLFKNRRVLGKYEFKQNKINLLELKQYLNKSVKKKKRINKI